MCVNNRKGSGYDETVPDERLPYLVLLAVRAGITALRRARKGLFMKLIALAAAVLALAAGSVTGASARTMHHRMMHRHMMHRHMMMHHMMHH